MLGTNIIGSPVIVYGTFLGDGILQHILTSFALVLIVATTFSFVTTRLIRIIKH